MEEIDIKKIDIEKILDMFEDDYVIPASKMERPQSALDREMFEDFNKRNPQADGGRIGFYKAGFVKSNPPGQQYVVKFASKNMSPDYPDKFIGTQKYATEKLANQAIEERKLLSEKKYKAGVKKSGEATKLKKEANFKSLVDKIFETEDFDNFKSQPTKAQLRFAKKAGKVREGTGIVPAQYITQFNKAIAAGVDSPEFKDILRITGRSTEDILKLNRLRPGGAVPIKVRAEAAAKSYPEDRKVSEEEKIKSEKKTKAKRAEKETVGKKYASEAELERYKIVNEQKKKLNKFFQENPKALLNTEFGKKIKELMDVRIDKDGNFFQNTRPDDYYIAKAEEGKIFDIFDINKIAKGQRSTKFTSNLNILPGQFNQAFIEGQVNKYFKKGGRLEGQTEILENISKYLDNIGVKVDIEDVGRIGGGNPVFFDSKTNRYPHIENTLKKMNIPDELLTEIKPVSEGVTVGANYVPKKLLTKTLGDMAISLGSPTALLGLNAYLGVDPRESLDRAILGGEVALAPSGIRALTSRLDAIKNPAVRKGIETVAGLRLPGVFTPANVLRAARFAQPLGIATLAGEGLYQLGKLGYEEQQMINEMRKNDPEAYQRYLAEQQELADVSA